MQVTSGFGAGPQPASPRYRAAASRAASILFKGPDLLSKGASIFCGKSLPLRGRIRAFQGEPVPPRYAPAARYPLRSPRGILDWRTTAMKYHKFCNCLSHRVFPAPRGKENQKKCGAGHPPGGLLLPLRGNSPCAPAQHTDTQ